MPETIIVVEYEPRYVDRVRQALTGLPVVVHFAKDGDEAVRLLETERANLIVLSSVIPRSSPAELIRNIRGRAGYQSTPILITISGYSGKSPKADAIRFGANDILPKPYTDSEFRAKIQEILGFAPGEQPAAAAAAPPEQGETVRMSSSEIFAGMVDEDKAEDKQVRKPQKSGGSEDLDKMLADTLSGIRVPSARKKEAAPAPPAIQPSAEPDAKAGTGSKELDKLLHDTRSGLEKSSKPKAPEPAPKPPEPAPKPVAPPVAPAAPRAAEPPKPAAPAPRPVAPPAPAAVPDRVHLATPVLTPRPEVREEEPEITGTRFGQYSLVEKIATGGMAEVWKAQMRGVEGFQKTVAIKKILPHLSDNEEFVTMFVDEAKLAAQLNHNNIIHIYDLGKIANSYYIAMEYIAGHDLKTILKRGAESGQQISVELALFIASKIAAALDYAHRKRDFNEVEMVLVHRDVSPQNVLISLEGDIKLCDFGIAKAASKASHTQAGALKGKIQYMSPEQAWGRSIDRRSDIFALAAVLFEMLAGRKLFEGDSEVSILDHVREARVTPPSQLNDEVTPEIDAIVLKALQKAPEARYQTAGEMARDIDAVLYSFRPTPTSADLAIYMHRLETATPLEFEPEPEPKPEPKREAPFVAPAPVVAAAPAVAMPPAAAHAEPAAHAAVRHEAHSVLQPEEEKKSKMPPIAAGIGVLVILGAAGAYFAMRGKGSSATPSAGAPQASTSSVLTTTAPPLVTATTTATTTDTTATAATTAAAPALRASEQALIDEEVKKRLAAERTKLEQQQRAQQEAAAQAAAQPPPPAVAQPAQQPAPVVAQQPIAPPPVSLAPQMKPQTPLARTIREGDFVEPGAPGLVAPELVRLKKPPYPPAAKMRKVEGLVVINALISESGRVLEVKILRGVAQNVGINEAAEQAVRESTFTPATKDGVRVKSYKTVTIPFKL
jgi:TonB family protein